ncbi:MAG: SDR family NAD(P)-dependent oxidoreductase [Candidatus Aminicenantes bacterium]|nr:MAG: SDR family NAD(P)-dependent oxidoreductase [Candidatus Aminicenantes bacterium]
MTGNHLNKDSDIAVIGMAGRFPLADNLEEFWENLKSGRDCCGDLPETRKADWAHLFGNRDQVVHFGFLHGIELFDAQFFGIMPGEALFIDPTQRLLLEVVYEAMEYGGYGGNRLANTETGVFISCSNSGYRQLISPSSFSLVAVVGNLPAVSAGRISHVFGLRGPSLLIDTACSSSLAALYYACESLKRGECPMAVVGAADIYAYFDGKVGSMDPGASPESDRDIPGHKDQETGAGPEVSPGCRVFDKSSGVVNGEGVGALLLKPLNKALADKDVICAVIKGSAMNHNGNRTATISGQRPESLAEVIRQALENARVHPETLSYIEASGAATQMGDPIEIKSISDAFSTYTAKKQFCSLGSVKANIGHLNHTSGMASLIKTILSLQHKQIPPLANFNEPNPYIDFENSPVYIDTQLKEWEVKEGIPRRAGVSSFSVNGTNCHVVLEEAPATAGIQKEDASTPERFHLVTLSAQNSTGLKQLCRALGENLGKDSHQAFQDICYTLNTGRGQHGHRLAVVCQDKEELMEKLSSLDIDNNGQLSAECANDPGIFYNTPAALEKKGFPGGKGIFLFSGGKADLEKTCWDFYSKGFLAARYMDECRAYVDLETKPQALYFAFQYALAKLWMDVGIKPAYVLGYGIGKYVSKAISGKLTLEQALNTCMAESEQENFYTFNEDKFRKNIELLYSQNQLLFLGIGAENDLAAMAEAVLSGKAGYRVLASYSPEEKEKLLLSSIGLVYTLGLSIDFSCLFPGGRVLLPTYPFNRRRYWMGQEHRGEAPEEEIYLEEFSGTLLPRPPLSTEYTAPKTKFEKDFADILRKFFGFEQVGIHDNFFEIGLNSLTLIHVNHLLKEKTGYAIPMVEMFEFPNIHELEQYLKQQDSGKTGLLQPGDIPVLPAAREKRGKGGLEIAVIGMAGKFPGARNVEEFWNNLRDGVESVTFFSDEELAEADVSEEQLNNPNYVKASAELEDKEYFDAMFFGYSPQEAEIMDPQVRLFHECSWQALEDAGYDPFSYPGSIGIYAGSASSFTWQALSMLSGKSSILGGFASTLLTSSGFISTRVSHKLDLKGPGLTVFSTCSTSLVAIHLACQALLNGECDMALAGGASITVQSGKGYIYQEGMVFSPDGHCRAFDARAKGAIFGEGIGIVVLKRLEEAMAHRDHIYAVVKGSAMNNDGMGKVSYTAPGKRGQQEVIRKALDVSGVPPGSITYIETHGTGTMLGDTIEIEALKHAFNTDQKGFCAIGSVKTNISHVDTAAGVAGFIKTVLALTHRLIPPSLNSETPNPHIDFKNSPFYLADRALEWNNNGDHGGPLRAGVSSFGIGGTNAHVILEEAPNRMHHKEETGELAPLPGEQPSRQHQLLLLSARRESTLDKMAGNLADYLRQNPATHLADVAYTLQAGRKHFQHRCMLVCSGSDEAIDILSTPGSRKMKTFFNTDDNRSVVFMFAGLGSQYVNMGLELYQKEPVFQATMDRCFEILKPIMDYDIKEILYPGDLSYTTAGKEKINQSEIAQVVVFIFEYALAKLLLKWGIQPNAVIGYSFGEYTAACISGVFSLEDALKLVVCRGQLIQKLTPGAMLSVPLPAEEVKSFKSSELSIAIDNGPSCIVAGPLPAIEAFEKKMKEKHCLGMRLAHAPHALHSRMMEPILDEFAGVLSEISLNQPQVPFISNVTGKWAEAGQVTTPAYWTTHLKETVRFADGIEELVKDPGTVFIEVGPGRDLSSLLSRYREQNPDIQVIDLVRNPQKETADVSFLLNKIGRLWLYGKPCNWEEFHFGEKPRRVSLPSYPFERQRYWIEGDLFKMGAEKLAAESAAQKKADIADWFYIPQWKRTVLSGVDTPGPASPSLWLIFRNSDDFSSQLVKQLDQGAGHVVTVCPGSGFSRINDDEYTINPGSDSDYTFLLDELGRTGKLPHHIVHLWNAGNNDSPVHEGTGPRGRQDVMDLGFYSLVYLARAIARQRFSHQIQVSVVTSDIHEVTGEETLDPEKATLFGPLKVIPQEYPYLICRNIDIVPAKPGSQEEQQLMGQLVEEFKTAAPEPVIAFRRHFRWVQTFEPVHWGEVSGDIPKLRKQGVYLITGGLGKIGLIWAEYLLKQFQARLILTGRTALPARDQWDQWLAAHPEEDPTARKIRKVQQLEQQEGHVLVFAVDAADREGMQTVIAQAEEAFGPINGVIHAAGDTGKSIVSPVDKVNEAVCQQQFRPKIHGLLVLVEVLKDKPLDFCFLTSSLSSILGGLGFSAYAAANFFMDAFVHKISRTSPVSWISVNWEGWEFKSLDQPDQEPTGNSGKELLAVTPPEGVEAFQRILTHHQVNQVVVSSWNLQTRIDKWVKLESLRTGETPVTQDSSALQQRPDLSSPYVPPSTLLQEKVALTWSTLFGFDMVGIQDDFFELGGDSLKAVIAISKIHKELNVEIPIAEFFNNPTIESLARYVNKAEVATYTPIEPVEKKEYYPLSSAQKRFYILQQIDPQSTSYLNSLVFMLEGKLEKEKVERSLIEIINRHESLRTSFRFINEEPVQKVHEDVNFTIEYDETPGPAAGDITANFTRPFDLEKAPLLRVRLIKLEEQKHVFMLEIHHIISDGTTLNILTADLVGFYWAKEIPPLRLQYKDFSQWQHERLISGKLNEQEKYWLDNFPGELPVLDIPTDYPRPAVQSFEGDTISFRFEKELKQKLDQLMKETGTTLFMMLLALYNILLANYTWKKDIIVGTTIAGRNHADLQDIIGLLIETIAIRNYPESDKTFEDFLAEVKMNTLNAFDNQAYPYGELLKHFENQFDESRNPLFDTMLIVQNVESGMEETGIEELKVSPYEGELKKVSKLDITLEASARDDFILFSLEYCTKLFKKETMETFAASFKEIISTVTENKKIKLKDIKISHQLRTATTSVYDEAGSEFEF